MSQQEFFSYVEQMVAEEATMPGNFLIPFFYLHLLCMPERYWHAPDLLRFPTKLAWQMARSARETQEYLAMRLTQYELLRHRLEELVIYLQSRVCSQANCTVLDDESAVPDMTATEVMSLLENKSFRAFFTDQVRLEVQNNARQKLPKGFLRENVSGNLMWASPELCEKSLMILKQHGWIDVLPASPGNDLLIRMKRFPAQPTTETSKNPQPHSVTL